MSLFSFLKRLNPSTRRAEAAKHELMANAEKALAMKKEAEKSKSAHRQPAPESLKPANDPGPTHPAAPNHASRRS